MNERRPLLLTPAGLWCAGATLVSFGVFVSGGGPLSHLIVLGTLAFQLVTVRRATYGETPWLIAVYWGLTVVASAVRLIAG